MLDKNFNILKIEEKWLAYWSENQSFKSNTNAIQTDKSKEKIPFCIMLPPPNVTGRLHMGHAFQQTLMDVLIRYHRMMGKETLWQTGTDHAGIATQMLVEKNLLAEENKTRQEIGRDAFLEQVWKWKDKYSGAIVNQMQRLGSSADWSRLRFTMDEGLSKTVRDVFVKLYSEGYIYRSKRLINWDPVLKTAVSDLEVTQKEKDGSLWHILYPFSEGQVIDGQRGVYIATTRPETMLADGAIAVHPEDERYSNLVGKFVDLPLCNRKIPIIADNFVDKEFGSGCVKITGAHDFNDYACAMRHKNSNNPIELITIFTIDAKMNDNSPEIYRGMDRYECRKAVIKDLEDQGFLEKEVPHKSAIPTGDRSGAVLEPMLTDQWFVSMSTKNKDNQTIASRALDYVKNGDIKFIPDNWRNTYNQWLDKDNIQDWCISRQLWWGHQIPAWYDEQGNIFVGSNEEEVRKNNNIEASMLLRQDEDVLDTWFSSALWSFSTLDLPPIPPEKNSPKIGIQRFHPTDVLITGFDIIFFWVARMAMMTGVLRDEVPFKHVYITGLVRDAEGNKMSKTKGNVIDPLDVIHGIKLDELIEKSIGNIDKDKKGKVEKGIHKMFPSGIETCGADALRFTFCALANTGRDIRFDVNRVMGYRNFTNKIWNAAKFILMNTDDFVFSGTPKSLNPTNQWMLYEVKKASIKMHENISKYRFDLMSHDLYELFWTQFCDWYLELAKTSLKDESKRYETQHTLLSALDLQLRMLHPIMPFLTEEIWSEIKDKLNLNAECLSLASLDEEMNTTISEVEVHKIDKMISVVQAIRKIRGNYAIAPNKKLAVILRTQEHNQKALEPFIDMIAEQGKASDISFVAPETNISNSSMEALTDIEVHIPMLDLIDKVAEISRLDKEIKINITNIEGIQAKLANEKFTSRAKPEVVENERKRLIELSNVADRLSDQRKNIENM